MANKHAAYDLAQMQSLPLEAKILMAKRRIQEWYDYWDGGVYVSFSGGKDSTVLLHLVRSIYPDVQAVFVNTGLSIQRYRHLPNSMIMSLSCAPQCHSMRCWGNMDIR